MLALILAAVGVALLAAQFVYSHLLLLAAEFPSESAAWGALAGSLTPWLCALLLQQKWSHTLKAILTAVICAAVAFVTYGFEHAWVFDQGYVLVLAVVYFSAQTTYRGLWTQIGRTEPSGRTASAEAGGGTSVIERVEAATSAS